MIKRELFSDNFEYMTELDCIYILLSFLALILCDFEKDKCSWSTYSEDKYYKWTRQSVNNLNNANLPGPPGDYLNDQATMFLYAGDKHAGENSTGTVYILGQ